MGIREKQRLLIINPPSNYLTLMGNLPSDIQLLGFDDQGMDLVHAFFYWKKDLEHLLPLLKYKIKKSGSIWISWPEKASRNDADLTLDNVRKIALDNELEEIRNLAFNSSWNGLRLVWPAQE